MPPFKRKKKRFLSFLNSKICKATLISFLLELEYNIGKAQKQVNLELNKEKKMIKWDALP